MKPILFLAIAGMLFATGCIKDTFCIRGQGQIKEERIILDDFNSIDLQGSMNVVISHGEQQEVYAEGHGNIIDRLRTRVNEGTWAIGLEQGCYTDFDLTVYIVLPDLESVELNGSGDILLNNFNNQGDLNIKNSGSGKISMESVSGAETMNIQISGSGPVQCYAPMPDLKNLDVRITGSGSFRGFMARTDDCSVKVSGSGSCEVAVNSHLDVIISGSGNVYYKGRPTITTGGSGSGNLIFIGR